MQIELKIFLVCGVIQVLYYLLIFMLLNGIRTFSYFPESLSGVSVVICAKNEAQNLRQNLKAVLIQRYKQYEVIVVNDQSDDDTLEVLTEYYKQHLNFRIVNISSSELKPFAGKKFALMKGIEAAAFDTIVVTDADCRPATSYWLAKLVGAYLEETKIVLAHSPFEKRDGFLNKLIRYENFITALQYFGFAKLGLPYMGVGRNLSYKKDLFRSFKGFNKTKDIPTGDDDLFINAVASGKNTEVCIDKDAFTYSSPETSFIGWLNQKRRHLRSGFSYKIHHQLLLGVFSLSGFLFYSSFLAVIIKPVSVKIGLLVFAGVLLLKLISTFRAYGKLGVADLILLSPLLDIIYSGYLFILFLLMLLKPKSNWK